MATGNLFMDFMSDTLGADNTASKEEGDKKGDAKETTATFSSTTDYILPIKPKLITKKSILAQTGTLDASIVGRGRITNAGERKLDLFEPTILFSSSIFNKIQIQVIAASPSSCHSLAICDKGDVYGWGRDEDGQLGLGSSKKCHVVPQKIELPSGTQIKMVGCAVGKHHSVLLGEDGCVFSSGKNHLGQLGINFSIEGCNKFRKAMVVVGEKEEGDDLEESTKSVQAADGTSVKFVKVSCGENFSVLLSASGNIYTAGSAEFGQLGNGTTGEHFISANKLAFDNALRFEPRTTFVENSGKNKTNIILEDLRFSEIACGKNHAIAIEAPKTSKVANHIRRVFSWGCGGYGCLMHGVQKDDYFPKSIEFFEHKQFEKNFPVSAALGASCTMVITSQGHVYYCGKHRNAGESVMKPQLIDNLANNGHVVTDVSSGNQSVFCTTQNGVTVSWGQGAFGELGYGATQPKSSSKPKFIQAIDSCIVDSMMSGYGHTLFLIRNEDKEDKDAIAKLKKICEEDVEGFQPSSSKETAGSDEPKNSQKGKRGRGAAANKSKKSTSAKKKRKT